MRISRLELQGGARQPDSPFGLGFPFVFWGEGRRSLPSLEGIYCDSFTGVVMEMALHQETDWVTFFSPCLFLIICGARYPPGRSACFHSSAHRRDVEGM